MVTIKSIKFDWLSTDNKKPYTLTQPMHVCMQAFLDSKPCEIRIVIDEGFKSDGLSVPKPFAWFLKQWDPTNPIYNIAGLIHDARNATTCSVGYSDYPGSDVSRLAWPTSVSNGSLVVIRTGETTPTELPDWATWR